MLSPAPDAGTGRPSQARLQWFSVCLLATLLWVCLGQALWRDHHSPLLRNVFPTGPWLDDLLTYRTRIALLGTPEFYVLREVPPAFAYLPGAAYLFAFLYALPHYKVMFLLACAGVVILLCSGLAVSLRGSVLSRVKRRWITVSFVALLFPLVFAVERGNVEVAICLLVAVGIFAVSRNHCLAAALLFGLAATIKPFSVIFFGLFLTRRVQWRPLLLATATTAGTLLACLWSAGPNLRAAAVGFYGGLANIEHSRAATNFQGGFMFDHSFFSLIKALALSRHLPMRPLLSGYYLALLVILIWGGWRVAGFPLLNRIAFYTVLAVAAAPISYEYTLIDCYPLLIAVMVEFCTIERQRSLEKLESATLLCVLLLFLPFTYYGYDRVSFGGQIEAMLLLILLAFSTTRAWGRVAAQTPSMVKAHRTLEEYSETNDLAFS